MVPELHMLAEEAVWRVQDQLRPKLRLVCADAADAFKPHGPLAGGADILFAYSSTWPAEGDLLSDFTQLCGTRLPVGTRVITTDRRLVSLDGAWRFDLLGTYEGRNAETGGTSVGYVQVVAKSLAGKDREAVRQDERDRRLDLPPYIGGM